MLVDSFDARHWFSREIYTLLFLKWILYTKLIYKELFFLYILLYGEPILITNGNKYAIIPKHS